VNKWTIYSSKERLRKRQSGKERCEPEQGKKRNVERKERDGEGRSKRSMKNMVGERRGENEREEERGRCKKRK